jgi:hypothetical protein
MSITGKWGANRRTDQGNHQDWLFHSRPIAPLVGGTSAMSRIFINNGNQE